MHHVYVNINYVVFFPFLNHFAYIFLSHLFCYYVHTKHMNMDVKLYLHLYIHGYADTLQHHIIPLAGHFSPSYTHTIYVYTLYIMSFISIRILPIFPCIQYRFSIISNSHITCAPNQINRPTVANTCSQKMKRETPTPNDNRITCREVCMWRTSFDVYTRRTM